MAQVTPQNGRRIAILAGDGALSMPLLDVVAKYGDRGCQFIWQNKGALAVGATLASFLAAPEDFINGTVQLTEVVAEHVVTPVATQVLAPIAEMPQAVAVEMAKGTNWTVIGIVALLLGALAVAANSPSWGWAGRLTKTVCKAIQDRWPNRGHCPPMRQGRESLPLSDVFRRSPAPAFIHHTWASVQLFLTWGTPLNTA